ncbi:VanZ family protein [Brevibacillus daliensis]|uniref:VanZ family protein n=1 Tax=Brevibacillus daliensis TaxID=2892995 RepID=UPI001E3976B7|nr:VanZ family protein [Brevibacillus daliensis]
MTKPLIKAVTLIIMIAYLYILTNLVFIRNHTIEMIISQFNWKIENYQWLSVNFIPFKTISYYLFVSDVPVFVRVENVIGNIIAFVPFGFLLPLLSKKFSKLSSVTIATFCLSLTYEILQFLFSLGSFDVDDLLLNTIGGLVGYMTIAFVSRYITKKGSIQWRGY